MNQREEFNYVICKPKLEFVGDECCHCVNEIYEICEVIEKHFNKLSLKLLGE